MLDLCKKIWCFTKKQVRVYPTLYCNLCFSNISHLHQFECGHYICIRCLYKIPNKERCCVCIKNVFYTDEDGKR